MDQLKRKRKIGEILRRFGLWVGVAGAVAGLSGCSNNDHRYRVTATVDINGATYSGSSVQEWTCREGASWAAGMDVSRCDVKGEAVVVDLKARGYLFLIIKGPHGDQTSMVRAMLEAGHRDPYLQNINLHEPWSVPVADMPMMVTFDDVNNPKSVKEVDPADLSKAFGRGVILKSITVEQTDEGLTRGVVSHVLPWLSGAPHSQYLTGRRLATAEGLAGILQNYNFIYSD